MKEIVKSQPIYKQVYKNVKHSILTGKLRPGTKVDIQELATRLNISRTPLREALRQLETEGLLQQDHRGTTVVQLDEEEMKEIFSCRSILESEIIKLVVLHITSSQIDDIQALINEAYHEYNQGNLMETLENNTKFHESIIQACPNKKLIQLLTYIRSLTLLYRVEVLKDHATVKEMLVEHQKILDAVKSGDSEAAVKAVQEHLINDQMRAMKLIGEKTT